MGEKICPSASKILLIDIKLFKKRFNNYITHLKQKETLYVCELLLFATIRAFKLKKRLKEA